jgi:internalin A
MKLWKTLGVLLPAASLLGCDQKSENPSTTATASAPAMSSAPPAPTPPPPATSAAATWTKKLASDCPAHPATVDFGDQTALEREVRRKLAKEKGPISPGELAQIRSINMTTAGVKEQLHQLDPCIFPMFTSLKDLFLPPGEYEDLTPIQKLSTLESLRASSAPLKSLRPIEGLKRLDRLDISHTLVGDDELKPVGSLVNLTELMLDEDPVSDLTPLASLKKLERLSIKKTEVKSLAPLASLKALKFLYIADTPVSDISPVQPLISNGMKLIQN